MFSFLLTVLNKTLRINFAIIIMFFSFPSRGVVDVSLSSPPFSWVGPYQWGAPKPFPCPSEVRETAAVYCLTADPSYMIASVDYISPDDPIMSLAGKSCTIEMYLRIKGENMGGTKAIGIRKRGWSKSSPVERGYVFHEFTKNSKNCISDLQSINDWGAVYFRLQGYSRNGNAGSLCADLYVTGENYQSSNLVIDRDHWTCSQGAEVSLPENKPVCDISVPEEIDFGTVGISSNTTSSEKVDIICNQDASISFYFTPAGTPLSVGPSGKIRLTLGPSVIADLCLQSTTTSKCAGGNAPYKWNETAGDILITTQLSVGSKATEDDYVGQTILVANIN